MAYEHLPRAQRRFAVKLSRELADKRPAVLTIIPRDTWPAALLTARNPPAKVWQSKRFLVQQFDEPAAVIRLSVCRTTALPDGRWDDGISWDDLQSIKSEIGHGDLYAVEIYPRDRDIVNVANMRHLWLLPEPLNLGWFK